MGSEQQVVVIAKGFVSALGPDARTSCAAARAGLTRARALEYFPVRDLNGDVAGLPGHVAPLLTEGFIGRARLERLLVRALCDLKGSLTASELAMASHFYLSLPNPGRTLTGLDLMEDVDREQVEEEREEQPTVDGQAYAASILERAGAVSEWPVHLNVRHVTLLGHTGTTEAIGAAMRDLQAGVVQLAVVGAVDSLLDEETLVWLDRIGRLKKPGLPDGLHPGEAAGCIALTLRTRTSNPIASVSIGSFALDTRPQLAGAAPTGEGLAAAIRDSVTSTIPIQPWLVTDHNGEAYRATDWGYALVRLVGHDTRFQNTVVWYPAISFGDTAAASGVCAVAMILSAFERNYAPSDVAITCSADDGPRRGALLIKTVVA